jgi:iron complex outermembrane receptor protein
MLSLMRLPAIEDYARWTRTGLSTAVLILHAGTTLASNAGSSPVANSTDRHRAQEVQQLARDNTSGKPEPAEESNGLQEIVVTARKRSEDIQSVPESVVAIGSDTLANAHVTRMDDLQNLVSNLNISTRGDNTPDVVLRGVGSFGVIQGVGFYANDVQLFDGQTVRPDDLERIEVLKGPQGTLYGGNNIGGAIKYITKLPTDKFEDKVGVEFGNYDTKTYTAVASGPLGPQGLDGRISVYRTSYGGYIYDPTLARNVDSGNQTGGRLTLLLTQGETTSTLFLTADRARSGDGANLYYTPSSPTDYSYQVFDGTRPVFSRDLFSVAYKLEHEFENGPSLTSITSYFHSHAASTTDVDKGPNPILDQYEGFRNENFSEELRLQSSSTGRFKWLGGLFWQGNDPKHLQTARQFTFASDPPNFADPTQYVYQTTNSENRLREYAAFGNASYDVAQWTVEAGVRVDYYTNSIRDPLYLLSGRISGTQVDPKFSVTYHFASDALVYGTISRGFEPAGLSEGFDVNGNPIITHFGAETTWNYELGLKSTLASWLRLNAALFYIDYQNRLFQTNILESGQFVSVVENIGPSHNYGAEMDLTAQLARGLLLTAGFGATKAVWGNAPTFDSDLNVPTNLDGRTAPYTPQYQSSLSLDWSHSISPDWTLGLRTDATFVGRQNWDVTDHWHQASYRLVNVGVRLGYKGLTLTGHVANVFDAKYNNVYGSAAELQAPFNVALIGRPRLWTVGIDYQW